MLQRCATMAALVALTLLGGCTTPHSGLTPPRVLVAPYDTTDGEILWAVVPVRNESGTTSVDPLAVSDSIVAAVQGIRGIRCLPLNRSIEAMRALGLEDGISKPGQAERLATTLGVDGILAGSITAYDPYDPPSLGLSLALYARPGAMRRGATNAISPFDLSRSFTDTGQFALSNFPGKPITVSSELLDARDHETLLELKRYAEGRTDTNTALNWRIYTASMHLYTQFVAHQGVMRLLEDEWIRLARQSRVAHEDE